MSVSVVPSGGKKQTWVGKIRMLGRLISFPPKIVVVIKLFVDPHQTMMMVGSKPHSLKLEFDEYTKHSKFVLKSENYTEQVFIKLGLS